LIDSRVREVLAPTPELIAAVEACFVGDDVVLRRKTWTFVNNKGGVGKTFDVMALAWTLATQFGLHVLVVDMDPQGNATRRAKYSSAATQQVSTLSEALKMAIPGSARTIRMPVRWDDIDVNGGSIDILPARLDLEVRAEEAATADAVALIEQTVKLEEPALVERLAPIFKQVVGSLNHPRERLKTILSGGVKDEHDIVLIDCPPSLGHLTQNAYVASDGVILCTKADYDSVNGAVRTRRVLDETRAAMGVPNLAVHGVLLTDLQRTGRADEEKGTYGTFAAAEESIKDLRKSFGSLVWQPFLQRKSSLAQNVDYGLPVADGLEGKDLKYVMSVLIVWAARLLEVSRG
jgi:chromosome partitioning protein